LFGRCFGPIPLYQGVCYPFSLFMLPIHCLSVSCHPLHAIQACRHQHHPMKCATIAFWISQQSLLGLISFYDTDLQPLIVCTCDLTSLLSAHLLISLAHTFGQHRFDLATIKSLFLVLVLRRDGKRQLSQLMQMFFFYCYMNIFVCFQLMACLPV
jgi:hypothetical protein